MLSGLLPDFEIRRLAIEQKMIDPFIDHQVRDNVVSFGLSSYGYDIRLAKDFKVPKRGQYILLDPKHPVEYETIQSDNFFVVNANDFVLARSLEYFRIPREVLAICLGKSTYARCFTGRTRVALANQTAPTLENMADSYERTGENFFGYGVNANQRIVIQELIYPRWVGKSSLVEVEIDNGQTIQCTPDHLFLTRRGQYVEASSLKPGVSIFPLYRKMCWRMAGWLLPGDQFSFKRG